MFTDSSNLVNQIIKETGAKHGLSAGQSYDIMKHQFEFVKHVMQSAEYGDVDTFKSVNLFYLGRFVIHSRYKRHITAKEIIRDE